MRTLTTIQSATHVVVQCELEITASDQSTTWTFSHGDLINLPTVNWDIDFLGGLGKASNYQITLSSSIDFIKNNLSNFVNAEARLNVIVNSDAFQPHVGRIRQFTRDARDPNIINFTIYDRFLDTNPKYPVQTLQQSYSTLHPDVITRDWGYPVYFGKHTRPLYHVPVDCSIGTLLGPRQVSSENHVNSVWFTANLTNTSIDSDSNNVYRMYGNWNQESGSDNTITSSYFFELDNLTDSIFFQKIYAYNNLIHERPTSAFFSVTSRGMIDKIIKSSIEGSSSLERTSVTRHQYFFDPIIAPKSNINPFKITRVKGSWKASTDSASVYPTYFRMRLLDLKNINPSGEEEFSFIDISCAGFFSGSFASSYSLVFSGGFEALQQNNSQTFFELRSNVSTHSAPLPEFTMTMSNNISVQLHSDNYRNYSIYSIPVNCSDIAYSENPVQIVEQLCNQASISYNQAQSSASQVLTSSYNMQCYFGEREEITSILDEFGKISNTYMWIADSGTLNMRTYENSDTADIDTTITTSDMLSFRVEENPLGISRYRSQKASEFKVDYQYDFQRNRYDASATAYPNDNAFCNSAFASGAEKQIVARTRYIMESDTAGYYLNNIVKKHTQSEEFVHLVLPARFMGLEVADVVKIQHPMLVGSESVYQVTHVRDNFQVGQVSIRAQELLDV